MHGRWRLPLALAGVFVPAAAGKVEPPAQVAAGYTAAQPLPQAQSAASGGDGPADSPAGPTEGAPAGAGAAGQARLAGPEEQAGAPPPPEPCASGGPPGSPARVYLSSLRQWLRESPHQALVTAMMTLTGVGLAWDGPGAWSPLFTVAAAALSAAAARHEAHAWDVGQVPEGLVMAQVAFAIALAVQSGFEGFQVIVGTALGFAGAYGCGDWARWIAQWVPGFAVLWYSVGAAVGTLLLTMWRKPVLSAAGPLFGGLLVSSGLGLLAGRIWAAFSGEASPIFPPPQEPWVASFEALLQPAGPAALAGHAVCIVVAVLLHSRGRAGSLAQPVGGLLGFVVVTALLALVGLVPACRASCPGWMLPQDASPMWPLLGCALWAAVTALAAARQLGVLSDWEAEDIWQSFCSDSGDMLRRVGYDRLASYSAAFHAQDGGPKRRRRLLEGGLEGGFND